MDYWVDSERFYEPDLRNSFPLIHMTGSWENLKNILIGGLRPSYCTEFLSSLTETKAACFPMISLSNVSIEYAISNQCSYGTFGLVLAKEWGADNDLNPVLYLEQKSNLTENIISNFQYISGPSRDELRRIVNNTYSDIKEYLTCQMLKIFAHAKNFDGNLIRKSKIVVKKYPFGMEREWRKIIQSDEIPFFLVGEDEISNKDSYNDLLNMHKVDFRLEELLAVIVETEYEVELVKSIICEKYKLSEFPKQIELRINRTRHVYDEG